MIRSCSLATWATPLLLPNCPTDLCCERISYGPRNKILDSQPDYRDRYRSRVFPTRITPC